MLITIKLDVGPPKHSASHSRPNEHEKRKLKEEEREARLDCWLGEGSEREPWNALMDTRIG